MTQDIGYVIVAYAGSAVLYGAYVTWLFRRERRLERSGGGGPR
jgi:hypothetical protein